MTVIVPNDYHARKALQANRVTCISPEQACKQDVRPLRIGLLALPPLPHEYELSLLHPLGLSLMQIIPVWLKLKNWKPQNLPEFWNEAIFYSDAISEEALDGIIVSASPDCFNDWEEAGNHEELHSLLSHAQQHCPSVLALGKASALLADLEGIKTSSVSKSLIISWNHNQSRDHPITGELDDAFWCPQGEDSCFTQKQWTEAKNTGIFSSLVERESALPLIFETPDHHLLMHTGYPEYTVSQSLQFLKTPQKTPLLNRWRTHRNDFFSQWLKYCYQSVSTKLT